MSSAELEGYTNITDEHFQAEVLHPTEIVLVVFHRPNCSSCGMFEPALKELAKRYKGRFKFMRYNTNVGSFFSQKFNIVAEPTTGIFFNGELQGTIVGSSMFSLFESELHKVLTPMAKKYNMEPISRTY